MARSVFHLDRWGNQFDQMNKALIAGQQPSLIFPLDHYFLLLYTLPIKKKKVLSLTTDFMKGEADHFLHDTFTFLDWDDLLDYAAQMKD